MKTFESFITEIDSWAEHPDIKNNPAMQAKAKAQQARRQKKQVQQTVAKKTTVPTQTHSKEGGLAGGALAKREKKALPGSRRKAIASNTAASKAAGIVKAKKRGLAKRGDSVKQVSVKDVTDKYPKRPGTTRPESKKDKKDKKDHRGDLPKRRGLGLKKPEFQYGGAGASGGDINTSKGHDATNN